MTVKFDGKKNSFDMFFYSMDMKHLKIKMRKLSCGF